MNVKITYLVPEWQNIGDKIIWIGAKAHYERIYGKVQHEVKFLLSPPNEPFETDILVVCGTPWIWDQCTKSEKYNSLETYLNFVKCKRKEAIGLGSCYRNHCLDRKWIAFQHLDVCDRLVDIWKRFDYISVRDWYAEYILKTLGIDCYLTPCPAYNAVGHLKVRPKAEKHNILALYDMMTGIGSEIIPPEYGEIWKGILRDVVSKYEIDQFLAFNQFEVALAKEMNVDCLVFSEPHPRGVSHETVENLFQVLSEARLVVSPRVHAAIPAISLNKSVVIVPIDTRHLTVNGARNLYEEYPELKRLDL